MRGGNIFGFRSAAAFVALLFATAIGYFTYQWGSLLAGGLIGVAREAEGVEALARWFVAAIAIGQPVLSVFGPLVGWLVWSMSDGERLLWAGAHLAYLPVPMLAMFVTSPFT